MSDQIFPKIPGYEITRRLGEGGMGSVYLGRKTSGLDREVAIKVVRTIFTDKASKVHTARFKREMKICGQLSHPNVITTLDGGVSDDGLFYLVMEFLPGQSLDVYVANNLLTEDEAISIGKKLCDALMCIHESGLIHRDIKPANVILQDNGNPVLIDFGLALSDNATRLTETGLAVGTLLTMPPEQLMGKPLDERADIYGLGATLFYGLTGQYPFNEAAIISQASGMPPKKVPLLSEMSEKISKTFSMVLSRTLQSDLNHRTATAEVFKKELAKVGKAASVAEKTAAAGRASAKPVRRDKTYSRSFLPYIFCVLALLTFVAHTSLSEKDSADGRQELMNLRRQLARAEGLPSKSQFAQLGKALIAAGEAKAQVHLSTEALGQHDLLLSFLRYKKKERALQLAELFIERHGTVWYSLGHTLPRTAIGVMAHNTDFDVILIETAIQQINEATEDKVKLALLPLLTRLTWNLKGPSDYEERPELQQQISDKMCKLSEPLHNNELNAQERQTLFECHFTALHLDLRKPARMKALKLLQKVMAAPEDFANVWAIVKLGYGAMVKSTKDNLDDVETSYHVFAIDCIRKTRRYVHREKDIWSWSLALASQLNRVGKQKEALALLEDFPQESLSGRDLSILNFDKAKIYMTMGNHEDALVACKRALKASDHNKDSIEHLILRIQSLKVIRSSGHN